MALDEKIVTGVQSFQEFEVWQLGEFSTCSTIAGLASQDKVPNTVDQIADAIGFQCVRKEMIHVSKIIGHCSHRDVGEAIETFTLLISIEGVPARGNWLSFEQPVVDHQEFAARIEANSEDMAWQI